MHQAAELDLDELCWDLAFTSVTLFESGSYLEDWRTTHEAALERIMAVARAWIDSETDNDRLALPTNFSDFQ